MTSGLAMKCRLDLALLARRHNTEPKLSCALPLYPPSDRAVMITGIASSASIDQERMLFRGWSLNFLPWRPPPLLFRHREVAGEIEHIEHDAKGRLIVQARVDHSEAKRCGGLSVAATIRKYELRDIDDPQRYHAVILEADLDEISLTPTPCSSDCVVTSRVTASPHPELFETAKRGIGKLIEITELLRKINAQPPQRTPLSSQEGAQQSFSREPKPYRQTPFGALIRAMEARDHHDAG